VPASALGLVTQGSDAGNAEELSKLIIHGNYADVVFHFELFVKNMILCFTRFIVHCIVTLSLCSNSEQVARDAVSFGRFEISH